MKRERGRGVERKRESDREREREDKEKKKNVFKHGTRIPESLLRNSTHWLIPQRSRFTNYKIFQCKI